MLKLEIRNWTDVDRDGSNWSRVSEQALRYDYFVGDIGFTASGTDFSTTWGWVPVLDFAVSLNALVTALEPHSELDFEFTESDHTISFRRGDKEVLVSTSYVSGSSGGL